MASEGYAIKLRNQRRNLALAEEALERMAAGNATPFDRIRYGSVEKLREHVAFQRGVVAIMEGY